MNLMNNVKNQIKRKSKKVVWKLLKPILPFVILIFVFILLVSYMLDGIFVQVAQSDSSSLSSEELNLKDMCIKKANYLNTCNNFLDGKSTNGLLDVDNKEISKEIEWSHLYVLMMYRNMEENEKLEQEVLDNIGKHFVSTFKYETSTIKTETKITNEDGEDEWIVLSEEKEYILIQSNTIYGNYTYNYEEKTTFINDGNSRITKKVYISNSLKGEQYGMLKKYLKENLNIKDEEIDTYTSIIMNSSNGYYDGSETNKNILIGKGMFIWPIPRIYKDNISIWI